MRFASPLRWTPFAAKTAVYVSCVCLLSATWVNGNDAQASSITRPWHTNEADATTLDAPTFPPVPNLIDVLSTSPNHTIFLRLLQRTRLVPTLLNLMEYGDGRGLTLFAPTDEAILRKMKESKERREKEQQRGSHLSDAADQGQVRPVYFEFDSEPVTEWEWALQLIERDTEPDSKRDQDDPIVPIWTEEGPRLGNVNAVLRQQMLYHMLNYTLVLDGADAGMETDDQQHLSTPLKISNKPVMLTTLHLPSRKLLHEPTRPGPIPHPPSRPPHPGSEDEGGLLGGEGQKVRMCSPDGKKILLGTKAKCESSVSVVGTNRSSKKGVIFSIDGVLDLPPDLATVIKTHEKLQHLLELTTSESLRSLTESAHATFFLPVSESFNVLSTIEKTFLMGHWELANQERLKLLGEHMSGIGVGQGQVAYADRIREQGGASLTTIFGGQVSVALAKDGQLTVEKAKVIEEDILTENGVIHIVDQLLLPFGDLGLSVEKTLLALNASRFVSLMHAANLQHYIDASPHDVDDPDNEALPWTFMVPRDDAISTWLGRENSEQLADYFQTKWNFASPDASDDDDRKPSLNGSKLIDVLKYHIAPKMRTPQNLSDGMLIGTELRNWRLKDARQRVIVGVDDDSVQSGRETRHGNGDVGFGGANVIAEPIIVGPSIIYLISQILEPPANPIQTAVSSLSLSTFVATVFSAELDKPIKRAPAITYLVPHNDAFSALGLTMPYLLLDQEQSRKELRAAVEYHAIDRIVYMKDFSDGSVRYPTLEGSDIWAGRSANGTVEVRRGTEGRNARVLKGDLLTSTGVLHEIDQVELPPTLDLTIGKLMKGAKAETMRDLIERAGYGWLLNGTRPSLEKVQELDDDLMEIERKFPKHHGKKKRREDKRHKKRHELFADQMQSYVVLCPTDKAFTRMNLTHYYADQEALKQLVQLHIIPSPADQVLPGGTDNQLPLSIRDASSFSSLLDSALGGLSGYGKLAFRKLKTTESNLDEEAGLGWMVGVADTRGTDGRKYAARVISFGRESLSSDRYDNAERDSTAWNSRSVGGVFTIDAVLQPYVPGWFYRWGWIVASCFAVALALGGIGYGVFIWWQRDGRIRLPDALEGEEE